MRRWSKHALDRSHFDEGAQVHHANLIGQVADDGQIVRDEDVGDGLALLYVRQQVEDGRLDRDVETGDGLVAEHDVGIARKGPCDGHALALSAAQRAGVAVEQRGIQMDQACQLLNPFA